MASFLKRLFHRPPASAARQQAGKSAPAPEGAPKVRIVFMGTPELASDSLSALLKTGYNVVGVVTKPDLPAGRKQEILESPVKKVAKAAAIPVLQPARLDAEAVAEIGSLKPDLIIVAAYGRILPKAVLDLPGFGCVNIHASLLPKYRGASPIQNALLAGETETGITLMQMDEGLDTGAIIRQKSLAIDPDDTQETLTPKLSALAAELLLDTLPDFVRRRLTPVPQDDSQATLCQLIEREDGRILWNQSAAEIYNRYRALTPWPGVFSYWKIDDAFLRLKLHRIRKADNAGDAAPYGSVVSFEDGAAVQTAEGLIVLEEVQLEGKGRMPIRDFLNGNSQFLGGRLE